MKTLHKCIFTLAFILAASTAQADRKEDAFYILLDHVADNPVLQEDLQTPLVNMLLTDARERGLGLADAVNLRADRIVGVWNENLLTSRTQPPEQLDHVLLEKLTQMPSGPETSRLMRLLQTSDIDCLSAETVTVYVFTNLASSLSLDTDGAHLETAPSVSLSGCDLVWVGPTLGSPELDLRAVQHIDDLIVQLSAHLKADDYVVLR